VAARPAPARVPVYADWLSVTANTSHTCGLRGSGEIWCVGINDDRELNADASIARSFVMLRAH
jgi:Regulator of chromosome condensation (RCC1) repeat